MPSITGRLVLSIAILFGLALGKDPNIDVTFKAQTGLPSKSGQDQVNDVLLRCPQLNKIVWPENVIWKWLTQAFDTSTFGYTIALDIQQVSIPHTNSESGALDWSNTFFIRVNPTYSEGLLQGQERPAEDVLCNLVFELNNVKLYRDHELIEHLARCGEIRREAYVYDCAQEEYCALARTAYFYSHTWLPFCAESKTETNSAAWPQLKANFNEWLASYPMDAWYPWKLFGSRYDQMNSGLIHHAVLHPLDTEGLDEVIKEAKQDDPSAEERLGMAFLTKENGLSMTSDADQEALNWMLKAANQENVLAEEHLEWMYRVGIGTKIDPSKSFVWAQKSAKQEDPEAEFVVGTHYEEGVGVSENITEAARWYQKSADQGLVLAEDKLGYLLLLGRGTTKNPQKALDYLHKAARENAHASFILAECYADGIYVTKNLIEAYKWCLVSLRLDRQAEDLSRRITAQLSDDDKRKAERDVGA
jgi:hypothetical protein